MRGDRSTTLDEKGKKKTRREKKKSTAIGRHPKKGSYTTPSPCYHSPFEANKGATKHKSCPPQFTALVFPSSTINQSITVRPPAPLSFPKVATIPQTIGTDIA